MRASKRRVAAAALVGIVAAGVAVTAALTDSGGDLGPVPQLRRLSEAQYRHSIADIFGPEIKVSGRFEPDLRVEGLLAAGSTAVSITPSGMEQLEQIARSIAEQVTGKDHRDRLVGCSPGPDDPSGKDCLHRFYAQVGKQLYRRPLGPSELTLAVDRATQAAAQLGDFYQGTAAGLAGMLTSLEFLFQVDDVKTSSFGGRELTGWSKATRLSYFLWNTTPDAELLAAAERGDLGSSSGLRRQVDRMIASPLIEQGVRAFFDDFLNLDLLEGLSKDGQIFPAFVAQVAGDAREQTLRTIVDLTIAQNGDYRDIFTTRRMAINRVLGPLYRIPVRGQGWSIHEFPAEDQRAGLLTQVAFLAGHSHPGRTSPTLRGKAIRELLMCETVPMPPANVNFTIVQDVSNPVLRTTRARLQAHSTDPTCAGCHRVVDPIGLALEHFDGAGQYRAKENGEAIDASAMLSGVSVAGAVELGRVLHDDPAVPKCLVRSAFRYAVGRAVQPGEETALEKLQSDFAANGYRFADLMRAIATSRAFYAPGAPAPAAPAASTVEKGNADG